MKLYAIGSPRCMYRPASRCVFLSLWTGEIHCSADRAGSGHDRAVMANVGLDLEDTATGTHREASSNSEGYFTIDLLPPSTYQFTAKAPGTSTAVISQITLQVNQTANINVIMKPGDLSQQVTVSGTSVALETETSSLGGVVPETTVVSGLQLLPIGYELSSARRSVERAAETPAETVRKEQRPIGWNVLAPWSRLPRP